jgi:hypothetical protein
MPGTEPKSTSSPYKTGTFVFWFGRYTVIALFVLKSGFASEWSMYRDE